eukprot:c14196_g1_i1 orf=194-2332(+)
MASKHLSAAAPDAPPGKKAKVEPFTSPKPALNRDDCNLDFTVDSDGITGHDLHNEGFAYCWSGARANIGIKGGKYCFGCRVIENQAVSMEDTAKDQQNVCRVGLSRGDDDVGSLGETVNSFGYGGTGKFSHNGSFTSYGGRFGVGDTVVCAVDLENPSRAKISFAKNGKWLGVGMEFDAGPKGLDVIGAKNFEKAIFPHVLLKNVKVRIMLSIDHGLEPLEGFKAWDSAVDDGNAVGGPKAVEGSNCEVIMMVGLPGSGKTTWAERWVREHPEKRYMLLGTNLALDQMKVPGLMRKRNYGERFERLMDRASKIFNQLMSTASRTSRNFIIDQTNVYRNARVRKLKPFRNFRKVAVVVFPNPEELKWRTRARARDMGKEVPEEAFNEMLANFVLPTSKEMRNSVEPFDEVRFIELQRDDAERYLVEMKSALPAKSFKKTENTFEGSVHDRNAREASNAPGRGTYTSAYELQDHNIREPPRMPVPHPYGSSGLQVSYASASQRYESPYLSRDTSTYEEQDHNLREPPCVPVPHTYGSSGSQVAYASAPQRYESPYLSHDRSSYLPSHSYPQVSRQGDYLNQYSREGSVSSYGGDRESIPIADHYARERLVHSYDDDNKGYPRHSSIHSYPGNHANPYGTPSQVPYGPSSGVARHDMPPQTLHSSAALEGGYSGSFAGNAGRLPQSQTFNQYGGTGISSSGAGQPMPPMSSYHRY